MDKGLPYYGVIMTKVNPWGYPDYPLPDGYSLCRFEAGDEKDWAELQVLLGQLNSLSEAEKYFADEFMQYPMTSAASAYLSGITKARQWERRPSGEECTSAESCTGCIG